MNGNEALIVHECQCSHDELAIHTVGNTAVAGDGVAKVLDMERPLDSRGEEAAERGNQRSERGQDEDMELQRLYLETGGYAGPRR